jgi:cytidine deaminase
MAKLTKEELEFVERVRPLLEEFLRLCKKRGIEPGAGSYVLSERNNIYHGVPFSVARDIHGEENAIGAMASEEGTESRLKIVMAIGEPEEPLMPCGMCRVAIQRYGVKDATILCCNQSLSKIRKFSISELYPHPYTQWE